LTTIVTRTSVGIVGHFAYADERELKHSDEQYKKENKQIMDIVNISYYTKKLPLSIMKQNKDKYMKHVGQTRNKCFVI
jgi:DNA-binding MltR family transcriptional regulator